MQQDILSKVELIAKNHYGLEGFQEKVEEIDSQSEKLRQLLRKLKKK